jgi:hypothetical protein
MLLERPVAEVRPGKDNSRIEKIDRARAARHPRRALGQQPCLHRERFFRGDRLVTGQGADSAKGARPWR